VVAPGKKFERQKFEALPGGSALEQCGAVYGKRHASFAEKLLKKGHATVRDYVRRCSIYHLFSRSIYGQIEKDNLRNRKKHSFDFMRTRLVLLDFILANQNLAYFETEQDKVNFFCEQLGVPKDFLPAKVYEGTSPSQPTLRYFVDKYPLFLAPISGASPVVTLSYVDSGVETQRSFLSHLVAYQGLFRQLNTFRFLYIAPKAAAFQRAQERFRAIVQRPLESDVSSEILRYFQIRKKWDNHEYVIPVTADLEFLNEARRQFHGERFDSLYRAWRIGELGESELRAEFAQIKPGRAVYFDTCLVNEHVSPLTVGPEGGEACMKEDHHPTLHVSRHPEG
jgi:hypothetical protein